MTLDERHELCKVGRRLFIILWPLAIALLLLGILAFLCVLTVYFLLLGHLSYSCRIMMIVGLFGLVVSAGQCAVLFCLIQVDIHFISNMTESYLKENLIAYNAVVFKLSIIWYWSCRVLPLLVDTLILWRVRTALSRARWVTYSVLSLWIITLVMTLYPLGLLSSDVAKHGSIRNSPAIGTFFAVGMALSFATNAITTSSVVWLFWKYRRILRMNTIATKRRSFNLRRLLLLLIDSGAIYCVLQLTATIFNAFNFPVTSAGNILSEMFLSAQTVVSAMYPTVIALLLNRPSFLLDTIKEASESYSSGQTVTMQIFTSVIMMESIDFDTDHDV